MYIIKYFILEQVHFYHVGSRLMFKLVLGKFSVTASRLLVEKCTMKVLGTSLAIFASAINRVNLSVTQYLAICIAQYAVAAQIKPSGCDVCWQFSP